MSRKHRYAFARVGQLPSGWKSNCAAGSNLSAPELREYLDCLSARVEVLNVDILAQDGPTKGGKLDGFDRAGWAEFLDFDLPFTPIPGTTPIYKDGPIGWHEYYNANRNSWVALGARLGGITDEAHEYQASIATWYERFEKAGGSASLKPPRKPTPSEMPGPIAPVDPTKPLRKALQRAPSGLAASLGLSPWQLKAGALAGATVLTLALLAPYARLLPTGRRV